MTRGKALSIIVHTASDLARQHGKYGANPDPPEQRILTLDHAEQLERIALEKIRIAAREDSLIRAPDFVSILYRWREWAGAEEVDQWIRRIVETDDGLSNFIDNCFGKVVSQTITDRVARISYQLNPSLQDFIGTDALAIRLDRLVHAGRWSEEKKLAVEQFLRERKKSNSPQNA